MGRRALSRAPLAVGAKQKLERLVAPAMHHGEQGGRVRIRVHVSRVV